VTSICFFAVNEKLKRIQVADWDQFLSACERLWVVWTNTNWMSYFSLESDEFIFICLSTELAHWIFPTWWNLEIPPSSPSNFELGLVDASCHHFLRLSCFFVFSFSSLSVLVSILLCRRQFLNEITDIFNAWRVLFL
jgi:hypothetical protein